ncbi:uncharacterized protein N7496_008239, partial [Penicillium cataractarum]
KVLTLFPKLLSESEKRHFSKYGKLPHGGLLGQKCKERTYFDSGDYALSAADRVTDNGAIRTGKAHPHRDSISHPYAPIPAASNVNKDATEDLYRKSASPEESPLLQQTNIEDAESSNKDGQDNLVSQEG